MQLDLKYFQLSPNEALQEIKLIHNSIQDYENKL
jgi:hypothetical protein